MDVTPRKKAKIITLGLHTSKSQRDIAKLCDVNQSTVSRILKHHSEGSSLNKRKGKCGRKRKTTCRADAAIIRLSKKDPRKTSDDLQKDIAAAGFAISSSTVRRRLLEKGRKARRPLKKQLLTEDMKRTRLRWANDHKHWTVEDWRRVLFSDESHFYVQGQRSQHVRRSAGEPISASHLNQSVKYPDKKMFWGCFTYKGVGPIDPCEGMMNSQKYIEILRRRVIPEMTKSFPESDGIFQQDKAPCHTSKAVKKFAEENRLKILDWPGNSPDINPIENLWAIIKKRLRRKDCTTKTKLIQAIIEVWFHDEEIRNICQNLVDSMPKRIKLVIKCKGGHIKY